MSRGRPRKSGIRYPSGKLKPSKAHETAVYWQRERDVLRAASRSSLLGSQIGILFRNERISASQFEAARRFAEARMAADAALGLPPRTTPAQNISAVGGASNGQDDEDAARRKAKLIAAYDKAEEAVGYGSRELTALQTVVVYERRPDDYMTVIALIAGLNKLVAHYGIRG